MGSIIGACAGSMCAGLCCGACNQCSGHKSGVISRIPYIFLFFLAGVFAIVMSLYGEKELNLQFYSESVCNNNTCKGNGSVYRVSFCLFIFELIHCIIIGFGAISFHWLFFAIKFILFCGGLTLTFLIGVDDGSSNQFFNGYAVYFARYISAIYLLLQILILISWAYKINEFLQEKGNEASLPDNPDQDEDEKSHSCNPYFWLLGIATFLLYIAAFTLSALFFVWYGDVNTSQCGSHRTLISLTIVICIINAVLSGIRGDGSFFVSAVVSFYCTFLCFAALQSDDNEECNIWADQRNSASLWIGYLITFLAIFYAAVRADQIGILWEKDDGDDDDDDESSMEQPLLNDNNNNNNNNKQKKDIETGAVDDSNYNDVDDDDDNDKNQKNDKDGNENLPSAQVQRISNVYFHFVMMLAACYMAMLFSNWANGTNFKTTGNATMWVNIISQYVTALLFWWTLIAPLMCPNRFPQNNDLDDV